jgi:lipoprotein NlpI
MSRRDAHVEHPDTVKPPSCPRISTAAQRIDYGQAIRLNPSFALAFNGRGSAYANKGDYGRAIEEFDQAMRLDAKYAVALNHRGRAKLLIGDKAGGEADIAAAMRLESQ